LTDNIRRRLFPLRIASVRPKSPRSAILTRAGVFLFATGLGPAHELALSGRYVLLWRT